MLELRYDDGYLNHPESLYQRIDAYAKDSYKTLAQVWRRPKRHNLNLQREALWCVLNLDQDYDAIQQSHAPSAFFRPSYADAEACFESESSLRLIPELLPLTQDERRELWRNTEFDTVMADEFHIGAVGQLALVERWHDWLWDSPPSRHAGPNRDAQMLHLACGHLARANNAILKARREASK